MRSAGQLPINPGNVGTEARDEQFSTIRQVAVTHGKPVRIGVNGLPEPELVVVKMQENTDRNLEGLRGDHQRVHGAVRGRVNRLAIDSGLRKDQIIICKTSRPRDLIAGIARSQNRPISRSISVSPRRVWGLARWSSAPAGVLFAEGIGDTIRVAHAAPWRRSPRGRTRRGELPQSLDCGRFLERHGVLGAGARRVRLSRNLPSASRLHPRADASWKTQDDGRDDTADGLRRQRTRRAKAANIGISLPGMGEAPNCPIYVDGQHHPRCEAPTKNWPPHSGLVETTTTATRGNPISTVRPALRDALHRIWLRISGRCSARPCIDPTDATVSSSLPTGGGKSLCFRRQHWAPPVVDRTGSPRRVLRSSSPPISLMKDRRRPARRRSRGGIPEQHPDVFLNATR
jgi:hypothetical protein